MTSKEKVAGARRNVRTGNIRITTGTVNNIISRAKSSLKETRTDRRKEEPGLTEEARNFVIRF